MTLEPIFQRSDTLSSAELPAAGTYVGSIEPLRRSERLSAMNGAIYLHINKQIEERVKLAKPIFNMNQGLVQHSHSDCSWNMGPVPGIDALRDEIAHWRTDAFKKRVGRENVMITTGANNAFDLCIDALTNPKLSATTADAILLPTPYFTNHRDAVIISGRSLKTCPFGPIANRGFRLNAPQLIEHAESTGSRLIAFSNPHNPTGSVFHGEDLSQMESACLRNGTALLLDESYFGFDFEKNEGSFNGRDMRTTVIIGSLSKTFGLGDLRLGYIIAESDLIEDLIKIQDSKIICPGVFSQNLALAHIQRSPTERSAVLQRLHNFSRLLDETFTQIEGILDFTGIAAPFKWIKLRYREDDQVFCQELLSETGVAATAGCYYGSPGWLRLSYGMIETEMELVSACQALKNFSRWGSH